MKKSLVLTLSIAFLFLMAMSCNNEKNNKTTETKDNSATKTESATVQYTCPMHPEVVTNAPGQCPKCGMDLVKK